MMPVNSDTRSLLLNGDRMIFRLSIFCMCLTLLWDGSGSLGYAQNEQELPEQISTELDYVLSLFDSEVEFDPGKVSGLIDFVRSTPPGSSISLEKRRNAEGAFHAFDINGSISDILGYAYNPEIPGYVTMPSSLQRQEWVTPDTETELRNLVRDADSIQSIRFFRGRENETITPDLHTGGYYTYDQDRLVVTLPGATGPVLISATIQPDHSDVGKRGCVAGDDKDWNYLYLPEPGLNKTGLGWVKSYMYYASSVVVYVTDSSTDTIHAGSFKWLYAGWSKINMVKSHHILKGMKRFALDFKNVLESPNLPEVQKIVDKYQELLKMDERELRHMVEPYLQSLHESGDVEKCSGSFMTKVSSGEYLQQMSSQEIIRILLLEYLKTYVGENPRESLGTLPLTSLDSLSHS